MQTLSVVQEIAKQNSACKFMFFLNLRQFKKKKRRQVRNKCTDLSRWEVFQEQRLLPGLLDSKIALVIVIRGRLPFTSGD